MFLAEFCRKSENKAKIGEKAMILRVFATILLVFGLSACASPAQNMNNAQIQGLNDDQLCHYSNNYRTEPRIKAEIARRGTNCDRYYRECLAKGNKPGTEAMAFCIDLLRENERMKYDEPAYGHFDMFGHSDYDRLRSLSH